MPELRRRTGRETEGREREGEEEAEDEGTFHIDTLLFGLSSRNIVPYIAITSDRTASLYLHDS